MAAMCAMYFLSWFQKTAVPGQIFNRIQTDLSMSAGEVTALGSIFFYVYAGMQLFVGVSADRFGGRRMLLIGGLIMCVGAVAFPLSPNLPVLYASRALTGLGASFMYLSIVKEIDALWSPRHFAAILGVVLFFGYSGGLAATAPLDWLAARMNWRPAMLAVGLFSAASLVVAWLTLRKMGNPVAPGRQPLLGPLVAIVRRRPSRPMLLIGAIGFPVYFVVQATIGKKFLEDACGLSSAAAARFVLLMMAVCVVMVFLAGPILKLTRYRRKPVLIASGVLALSATLILTLGAWGRAPAWVFLAAFVLLAASTGAGPAATAAFKELNPPDVVSQSVAVLNCLSYLGVGALSNVSGFVLDRFASQAVVTAAGTIYPAHAYAVVFAVLAVLSLVALLAVFWVPETRGRSRYRALGRLGAFN